MTEQEWNTCVYPLPMLEFLRGKASSRKLRLFSCACCRDVWQLISDERLRNAVEMAEKFADRLIPRKELHRANASAWLAHKHFTPVLMGPFMASVSPRPCSAKMAWATALACAGGEEQYSHIWHDSYQIWRLLHGEAITSVLSEETWQLFVKAFLEGFELQLPLVKEHFRRQTDLLRDIFGNPFRLVEINPAWLTWSEGLIPQMAQEIYETPRFAEMPILADALEDAGCRSEAVLEHCRSNNPHARGCWVVDLLLGKS